MGFNLFCITVNHNIREKKESSRDAEFVKTLSKKLDVPFFEKVYEHKDKFLSLCLPNIKAYVRIISKRQETT